MRVFDAPPADRFRIRLEHGDELPRRLEEELLRRGCETALVTGTGSLDRADIAVGAGMAPAEVDDVELVALSGEVALRGGRPVATLRVAVSSRGVLHAGLLAHGIARDVLLVVDAFESEPVAASLPAARVEVSKHFEPSRPVAAPRAQAPAPTSSAAHVVAPAPTPAPAPAPSSSSTVAASPAAATPSWADVAAVSAVEQQRAVVAESYAKMAATPQRSGKPLANARPLSPSKPTVPKPVLVAPAPPPPVPEALRAVVPTKVRRGEELLYEDPIPEQGDYLEHPQFGLCAVEGDDVDGAMFIRIPSGARKSIKLDFLQVLPAVTDDQGRRVFKIEGPRRKR